MKRAWKAVQKKKKKNEEFRLWNTHSLGSFSNLVAQYPYLCSQHETLIETHASYVVVASTILCKTNCDNPKRNHYTSQKQRRREASYFGTCIAVWCCIDPLICNLVIGGCRGGSFTKLKPQYTLEISIIRGRQGKKITIQLLLTIHKTTVSIKGVFNRSFKCKLFGTVPV